MDPLLAFRDVSYRVGSREILRAINLAVNEGETLVLLGRSGSGKTTLMKLVNRLLEPTRGDIEFAGVPVRTRDVIELRRSIGYVIQDGGLLPHFTVAQNIALVPTLNGTPPADVKQRVLVLMDAMRLPREYASRYPRQLSGGEKQRVGIARALAANPKLLLLDEPFASLDPVTRYELQQHFLELRRKFKQTAIFVTHDIREALMVGSRIALLHNGMIDVLATPQDFLHARTEEARTFLATLGARA